MKLMVYTQTAHQNGDEWGMVQMALLYHHYILVPLYNNPLGRVYTRIPSSFPKKLAEKNAAAYLAGAASGSPARLDTPGGSGMVGAPGSGGAARTLPRILQTSGGFIEI